VPPTHAGLGVTLAVTPVGAARTVRETVAVVVPQTLVAAKVYVPLLAATTPLMLALDDVGVDIDVPPGPVHKNDVAPVEPLVRFTLPPRHTLVGFTVAVTAVGVDATTETDVVVIELVPHVFVAENV